LKRGTPVLIRLWFTRRNGEADEAANVSRRSARFQTGRLNEAVNEDGTSALFFPPSA
jgi:hypothetical protein